MRNSGGCEATLLIPLLSQDDGWLRRCVDSAASQTARCEVLVVVSDGTPPSNLRVLESLRRRFDNLTVLRRPRGKRFAGALNFGIRSAASGRIGFLMSDDWLEPGAVRECLGHPQDIVSTGCSFYAADGITRFEAIRRKRSLAEYARLPSLESKAAYLGYFFLFSRKKLLEAGGLDETLGDTPGVDDYDLIWVLLERGATVGIVERSLYNCRDHAGERLTNRAPREMLATLSNILDKHEVAGRRKARLLAEHSLWFGKPIHRVLAERGWTV